MWSVSRETLVMLVNRIFCDYSPVLQKMLVSLYMFKIIKLVLRNMWGMFVRMNAETESRLFIFVLSRCLIASRCFT